jgi:ATP-dependent exoDNAse (exonuclease V) alpha subunit
MLWEMYYRVKELFMPPIDYSYAITVHRSQGSEWERVYVEMKDIMKNRRILERNKLIYVACSRAMGKLILNMS